jgi:hypothetical protein
MVRIGCTPPATNSKSGGVTSGALVRTDAARLAAGDRPCRVAVARRARLNSLFARCGLLMAPGQSCSKRRSIRLPALGRRRSRSSPTDPTSGGITEDLVVLNRGTLASRQRFCRADADAPRSGRSKGINGADDYGREHDDSLIDVSAGVAQTVEDLKSAIAYGRKLPGVRPGPVLLAGQSRGGFSPRTMRR